LGAAQRGNGLSGEPDMQYIHFTDLKGARGIKSTSTILGSSYGAAGVFAVEEGSLYVPGVIPGQGRGRAENREVAVVFTTKQRPDYRHTEEVAWREEELPVTVKAVLPAKKAIDKYFIRGVSSQQVADSLYLLDWQDTDSAWRRKVEGQAGLRENGMAYIKDSRIRLDGIFFTVEFIGATEKPEEHLLEGFYKALPALHDLPITGTELVGWEEGRWRSWMEEGSDYQETLQAEMKLVLDKAKIALALRVASAHLRRFT